MAISYEPARHGGYVRDILDAQKLHTDTVTAILEDLPKNAQVKDAPHSQELEFNKVVLVPHSMGSLPATERARLYPEETQAVIYMGSVGLEPQVMFGLVGRVLGSVGHETAGKFAQGKLIPGANRLNLAYKVVNYYLQNPGRTLGEIATCFAADLQRSVGLIGELSVRTGALYFENDKLVPPTPTVVEATRELVDICEVMEGVGHLAPQRQPEQVAAAIHDMSRQLI